MTETDNRFQGEIEKKTYLVKIGDNGIYVRDTGSGDIFFQTNNGSWYWLTGRGSNPFDEDAEIPKSSEWSKYLSSIVLGLNKSDWKEKPNEVLPSD